MGACAEARAAVGGRPTEILSGCAGMQRHPDLEPRTRGPVLLSQPLLAPGRGLHSPSGIPEDRKEAVPLAMRCENSASMTDHALFQQIVMYRQRPLHGLRRPFPVLRRTFYVGEKECDLRYQSNRCLSSPGSP